MQKQNIGGNYFDKYSSTNPAVKMLMRVFCKKMADILRGLSFSTLLDIGCGEGHLTSIIGKSLDAEGRKVIITALEHDDETVQKGRKLHPELNVNKGNILELQGNYDILIASEVLEHIEDYNRALNECGKVSGTCIFSVPNEPWFRLANICRLRYLDKLGNTPGHVNNWTKSGFMKALKGHFNEIEISTAGLWNIAVCRRKKAQD